MGFESAMALEFHRREDDVHSSSVPAWWLLANTWLSLMMMAMMIAVMTIVVPMTMMAMTTDE